MDAITRRRLLALSAALLAWPLAAAAQPAGKAYRIGVLWTSAPEDPVVLRAREAFRQGLGEHGLVEGQHVTLEIRYARGKLDLFPELAADLVRSRVDVILVGPTQAALAARKATSTIPIVFGTGTLDPVAIGLVSSLARPGGNATGVSFSAGPEIAGKLLQLLREAVPHVSRVAVLSNPGNPAHALLMKEAEVAARALGLELRGFEAPAAGALDGAFAAIGRDRAGAVFVPADGVFFVERARIAGLAVRQRLPGIYGMKEQAEAGGLMAYAPSLTDNYRRAAGYVAKILRGARPADLPVEQPTRFELVLNVKTARALGLTIPPSLLQRADQVIE